MDLCSQNILMFNSSLVVGGTTNVILQLCEILIPHVNKIVVCSIGGEGTKVLRQMGIKHYIIDNVTHKNPVTFIKVIQEVTQIIKDEKISIVHTHHRMAGLYAALLHKKLKFIFINTSHNTFYNNRKLTHFAYKDANLIACGEMVKKNLIEYFGLNNAQITVVRNAVKPFDGMIVRERILQDLRDKGFFLVGNIGRLSEQKGMEYFIRSLPLVKNSCSKVKYIIIGDGPDRKSLEGIVKELGIDSDVLFLGYRNDIQNLMAQLDLVVLSSLWEGLPLTPMESYSVGTPVIATAVDGTVEILRDSVDGYLIEPKNVSQIAEKVVELEKDREKLKTMGDNCRQYYKTELGFNVFAGRILSYYGNLCAKN